uniref:Retrovirus-related Pol polyprotein from transposon TNT 1-94-like beta-barrel domain-containing protein n=1 Tax=Tanacetum cinerariifolium TaxID=118510 RepID=A0A6L2LGM0_TANCI|nr:hypothetical protein [Tanacetum cinerariifolium]
MKRLHVIDEALCIQLLKSSLKVKEYELSRRNFNDTGLLWFWYKREEVKTQTWENQEKRKAEMEMKRLEVNVEKALNSFLKGTARGSTLAMVGAGLVYWEIGKKNEGVRMYKRVGALGDLAGQSRFETYVQSKDIDLWQVIQNGDFYFEVEDLKTKMTKETPYELLKDDQKKQLGKNNEAKMTLHNALPRKERAKVTAIEEEKDLATLLLDELIGNLKVYEMVLDNDGVAFKITKEKFKSLALNAKGTREQTRDNKGHFASECKKSKENKAFVKGAWSDSEDDDEPQDDAICVMAIDSQEVCLKCDLLSDDWIMDNGCTKHIIENRRLFTSYKAYDGGHVVFRSNLKGKVIGGAEARPPSHGMGYTIMWHLRRGGFLVDEEALKVILGGE